MKLKVRSAHLRDAQRICEIRNEPQALAVAANQGTIPLTQHIGWFKKKYFSQDNNHCYVVELDDNVVGYCRFDHEDKHYLISIAIDSSTHGKGVGTFLLKHSIEQLKSTRPIHAEVRKNNSTSIRLFQRAGFRKISEDDKNIYFQI
jgi:ribosomal protein S18 acetylase RimI-like enzyme